jgi:hypothetical protein
MRWTLAMLLIVGANVGHADAFDHGRFDRVLRAHVEGGRVDYAGIKRSAMAELDAYLASVARARLDGLSKPDRLAFFLNAYNALVIREVARRYPLTSVKKVPGFFKGLRHKVAGKVLTLDELEHKTIRPEFKDARVHFALVCAARSCPPLRAAAFRGASLDRVLDRLTRSFINSWHGVRIKGDSVRVSQLFNWFAEDFKRDAGSVGRFLARYHKTAGPRLATMTHFEHLPYDWSLNAKSS